MGGGLVDLPGEALAPLHPHGPPQLLPQAQPTVLRQLNYWGFLLRVYSTFLPLKEIVARDFEAKTHFGFFAFAKIIRSC